MSSADFPFKRITRSTVAVLKCFSTNNIETWGLEISKQIGYSVGTVYPILEKLEEAGWLEANWELENQRTGPRRRLYKINPDKTSEVQKIIMRFEASKDEKRSVQFDLKTVSP